MISDFKTKLMKSKSNKQNFTQQIILKFFFSLIRKVIIRYEKWNHQF